jgi:hypothetical protein
VAFAYVCASVIHFCVCSFANPSGFGFYTATFILTSIDYHTICGRQYKKRAGAVAPALHFLDYFLFNLIAV